MAPYLFSLNKAVRLKVDTKGRGNIRIVDIRIHADRMYDHVERNRDRPFDERVFAFDDELSRHRM